MNTNENERGKGGFSYTLEESLAIALAEGGVALANAACRYVNKTDAMTIAGARFPAKIDNDYQNLINWLNDKTRWMCDNRSTETFEETRYCLIGDILAGILEGRSAEDVQSEIEGKIKKYESEIYHANHTIQDRYSDREGLDEESDYIEGNRGGDRKSEFGFEEEECDWWTRKSA